MTKFHIVFSNLNPEQLLECQTVIDEAFVDLVAKLMDVEHLTDAIRTLYVEP